MTGKEIRMQKLLSRGENAIVIAIDHGYMDGPIPGMENLPKTIEKIDSCVDGILIAPGMLKNLGSAFNYKGAPIPIVRLNWSTVFCFEWHYSKTKTVQAFSVKDAVEFGAEIVLISLTLKTGDEANDAHNVEVYSKLCNEARGYGIPVIGEYFPNDSDNISKEEMHDQVLRGCRILAELGADLIKTFHTYKFKEVVEGCPLPILGLGGHTTKNPVDSLQLAQQEINDGCRGVVFGRNAIQRPDPKSYQRALCEVVKHGMDPNEAVKKFKLK
jgi:DhnA family fructose-bisphosphate aldolase class Ia